jgi:hypothetical protein
VDFTFATTLSMRMIMKKLKVFDASNIFILLILLSSAPPALSKELKIVCEKDNIKPESLCASNKKMCQQIYGIDSVKKSVTWQANFGEGSPTKAKVEYWGDSVIRFSSEVLRTTANDGKTEMVGRYFTELSRITLLYHSFFKYYYSDGNLVAENELEKIKGECIRSGFCLMRFDIENGKCVKVDAAF